MENKEVSAANDGSDSIWQKCPVCERGGYPDGRHGSNYPAPSFRAFLPLVKHLAEHFETAANPAPLIDEIGELWHEINTLWDEVASLRGGVASPRGGRERKVSEGARRVLPTIADWLEQALSSLPEMFDAMGGDMITAEKVTKLVAQLPAKFLEQREFLLAHEQTLRDATMDNKWPRLPENQAKFVADSMAGAEWQLSAPTSREYVRLARPKAGNVLVGLGIGEGKWWELSSGRGRPET
jgi:hypothetical protein